ncbi:MAG: hypothetical protein IT378_16860, partial [Sandaracinaceae bacterium]|nr:hypothetical protein [Sandaracinaceae bacterium]
HAHRAASWIPGLDLRIYSGCGHFPHLERTDAVAADLGRFYEASPLSLRMSVPVEPPRASWIVRAARGVGRFFARLFGR